MKIKINYVIFILINFIFLTGCSSSALFFVNNLARFDDYNSSLNIAYGKNPNQTLDIYWPDTLSELDKNTVPIVIFFYGGCWGACSDLKKQDYRFVAQALTASNIIAVVVIRII